ncbi:TIGR03745 family integrating conjugative element membrane protein [Aromatoleum evansii]|uniref:TIGR03745 family integrating conjugative element membrane protein n=1 Tax=Aromatoleum evansii TaxID=59406 RepID=UPI00145FA975|nr:TIGR03745 family integrating conjugative element membrane protein [Aromatoleum evansii]NMG30176.1 TIGR03745 family integrating conjugative element membrane protein [Aromatoleum evansii]
MKLLIPPSGTANAINRHLAQAPAPGLQHRANRAARAVLLGLTVLGSVFIVEPALAELPTAVTADGAASGDYIAIGKEYFKNGLIVLGLIIATLGFIAVAAGGIAKFNEYRIGRAELGDLGVLAVVGAVVLVLMVYLLNEAAVIIT